MQQVMQELCPCGKGKSLIGCCGPLLSGKVKAKTPEQLMRSRYTAYALGGHGEYLLQTWFPATAAGLTAEHLSDRSLRWQRLEVLEKSQAGDEASVEFKAHYLAGGAEQIQVMHEVSEFKRVNGTWYYVGARLK